MIAFIRGTVVYKDAEIAILETGGIGYELVMSVHAWLHFPPAAIPPRSGPTSP